jgi:hypothetical protein
VTARLPKKKLRLPVGDEWNNLPEGRHEARKRGLNRYIENGELFELRRSNTDTYPQGKPERVSSRKANRGQRSPKTIYYTEKEFIEWGRRNGYSTAESKAKFQSHKEQGQGVFKKQKFKVDIDHMQPHASDFQNPGETHRNKAPLKKPINLKKTDKLQTREERLKTRTPSSKAAAIRAEFRNEPIVSDAIKTKILTKVANDPTRETARQQNKRLKAAQSRRLNWMKKLKYGVFGTNTNTQNMINRNTSTPKVKSSYNVRSLNFPASADAIQTDVKFDKKPTVLQIMKQIGTPHDNVFYSPFGPPITKI